MCHSGRVEDIQESWWLSFWKVEEVFPAIATPALGQVLISPMENICKANVRSCLLHQLLLWGLSGWFPHGAERLNGNPRCDVASALRSFPCLVGSVCHPPASTAISPSELHLASRLISKKAVLRERALLEMKFVSHSRRSKALPFQTKANKVLIVNCLSLVSIK